MKRVYITIFLALALGLSACSQKLADKAVMAESAVILPAPVAESKTLGAGVCASDGIGGTGCPAID